MLRFTSILKLEYEKELERLMFFNPGQETALAGIVDSVEKFGSPSMYVDNGNLRVKVEKLDEVQTLFALENDILAGILVYSRLSINCLTVIHIAVGKDYSSQGIFAEKMLVMRLLKLLRENVHVMKDVDSIRILYSYNRVLEFPA